jgi:hypothetical protein
VNNDTAKSSTVYDLPREILDSLQLKQASEDQPLEDIPSTPPTPSEDAVPSSDSSSPKAGMACTLCSLAFADVQDQRSHARSDLHGYNLKQRLRGLTPVDEGDFEKLVGDLDESISGSDTDSESDSDEEDEKNTGGGSMLSALLKKQAKIGDPEEAETFGKKRKRGAGKPPLIWFKTSTLPTNTSLGIYRAMFSQKEQLDLANIIQTVHSKQLPSSPPPLPPRFEPDGGVPLPKAEALGPHIFLCMMGGGHFAAMIVSLKPKITKQKGIVERQATVLAHKTFHRYTTRRKQGGAQSASDAANGKASSAGSSLRRYNEVALETDIRQLLAEWKTMIDTSDLLFFRATGTSNRRVLFGPYEGQILRNDDVRNRGFPFSTRRATQAELMRSFVELTRVKVSVVDEAALAAAAAEEQATADRAAAASLAKAQASAAAKAAKSSQSAEEEAASLHTSQIEALIRRSKIPALLSYLTTNSLDANYELYPPFSQTHHHAPYPLHLAASINSPALITALLVKAKANPTLLNGDNKPAFELAGDRATRDAFRLARSELGELAWDWSATRIPDALTKSDIEARASAEKAEAEVAEAERRRVEMERLKEEEKQKQAAKKAACLDRTEKKHGKGKIVGEGRIMSAEERREEESRGMAPEMKMRLERERRARAAEERMKKLVGK